MWTRVAFRGEEEITAQGHERRVITSAKILGGNIHQNPQVGVKRTITAKHSEEIFHQIGPSSK